MIHLLMVVGINQTFYFFADAYYANRKIIKGLFAQGNHLVTRAKSNAVAYEQPLQQGKRKRGRPKIYGKKVALKLLFNPQQTMEQADSPVYGEKGVTLQYRV